MCSGITSTNSRPFRVTTCCAIHTNYTAHVPQSYNWRYYVNRILLEPQPLCLQKHTDLRKYDFGHSPGFWLQPTLANVVYAWSWKRPRINAAMSVSWKICKKLWSTSYCVPQDRISLQISPYISSSMTEWIASLFIVKVGFRYFAFFFFELHWNLKALFSSNHGHAFEVWSKLGLLEMKMLKNECTYWERFATWIEQWTWLWF